ncbi:MAG: ROK family transcriptional regulator [Arcanobacterium sp.]
MNTGMQAQSMRLTNTSLVLRTILSAPTPISRTIVADQTGLTSATVSRLVDTLIDAGLLIELEPERSSPGRPSLPLQASSRTCVAIGLEVNIDYLALCVMDISGDILEQQIVPGNYRQSDPVAIMERLAALVDAADIPDDAFITGLILNIPGICTGTTVRVAPNLGWHNVDLKPLWNPRRQLPELRLMNEADGGGYAVLYDRPGRMNDDDTFAYISGDVGIGAAMFFNGRLLAGRHGWAGEFGHICVDPAGPKCACGSNGCLEQYSGFDAILAAAGLPAGTRPAELIAAFDAGDLDVRAALDQASTSLGRGVATIVNLLDVDVIVFGGTMAVLLSRMQKLLTDELEYRVLGSRWSSLVMRPNTRGPLSASLGACHLSFEELINSPEVIIK